MGQPVRNSDRLSEAMRTIDELASQEKQEIKELLSTQFGNFRKTLLEIEPEIRSTVRHTSDRFTQFASATKQVTQEKAKQMGRRVDQKVHEAPWAFMGLSALAGIVAGYYIRSNFGSERHSEKAESAQTSH